VTAPEPQTLTVLQDVVVLAAGQQIQPQADGKPISVNVVTLLLKPEDAEKLVLATSLGGIYFVLRNGADQELSASPPVGLTQLAGVPAPSLPLATPTGKLRTSSRPYEVETILGDKRVVNGFH
jgi:pilus assembly protein CpaB